MTAIATKIPTPVPTPSPTLSVVCPEPVLPNHAEWQQPCNDRSVGSTCKAKCSYGYEQVDQNYMFECQANGAFTGTINCRLAGKTFSRSYSFGGKKVLRENG